MAAAITYAHGAAAEQDRRLHADPARHRRPDHRRSASPPTRSSSSSNASETRCARASRCGSRSRPAGTRAQDTRLAANVVSLLSAAVLYIFATGVVKGFGFALGLSTLIDLAVLFWFTKPMVSWLARFKFFNGGGELSGLSARHARHRRRGRAAQEVRPDGQVLAARQRALQRPRRSTSSASACLWYAVSGVLVGARDPGHRGQGPQLRHRVHRRHRVPGQHLPAEQASQDERRRAARRDRRRSAVAERRRRIGHHRRAARLDHRADRGPRRRPGRPRSVEIIQDVTGASDDDISKTEIGASWGQEVAKRALIGVAVFLVLVVLFIWVYFREWKMSVAALVALAHDIVITIGVYALSGFPVTPAAVTGLLAILGFSLYDTVVVFDKVRENTHDLRTARQTYAQAANLAVNQTLVRSINTSIVALIPIGAILYVGAVQLGAGSLQGPRAGAVRRHGGRCLLLGLHRAAAAGAAEVAARPRSSWPSGARRPGPVATPTATPPCRRSPRTCRSTTSRVPSTSAERRRRRRAGPRPVDAAAPRRRPRRPAAAGSRREARGPVAPEPGRRPRSSRPGSRSPSAARSERPP